MLKAAVAVAASFNLAPQTVLAIARVPIKKNVPVSGEKLSLMGVGSSRTFDVRLDEIPNTELVAVLQRFFDDGGQCVDSSPMYGNAEAVIGALSNRRKQDHKAGQGGKKK